MRKYRGRATRSMGERINGGGVRYIPYNWPTRYQGVNW